MLRSFFILVLTGFMFTGCSQSGTKPDSLHKQKSAQFLYACGVNAPEAGDYVNDFVHILTKEQVAELDALIQAHEKSTSNQLAVLTVDSTMLGNCNIKDYGQAIGNAWGVGQDKQNNGVVIVLAPSLRQVSVSNGYGIEARLSDEETQKIINGIMTPEFKQGAYFEGLKKGLQALMEKIK